MALSPVSMLVTCDGPDLSAQLVISTATVRTTISVPETDSTCCATLARPTATGSSKPWP